MGEGGDATEPLSGRSSFDRRVVPARTRRSYPRFRRPERTSRPHPRGRLIMSISRARESWRLIRSEARPSAPTTNLSKFCQAMGFPPRVPERRNSTKTASPWAPHRSTVPVRSGSALSSLVKERCAAGRPSVGGRTGWMRTTLGERSEPSVTGSGAAHQAANRSTKSAAESFVTCPTLRLPVPPSRHPRTSSFEVALWAVWLPDDRRQMETRPTGRLPVATRG